MLNQETMTCKDMLANCKKKNLDDVRKNIMDFINNNNITQKDATMILTHICKKNKKLCAINNEEDLTNPHNVFAIFNKLLDILNTFDNANIDLLVNCVENIDVNANNILNGSILDKYNKLFYRILEHHNFSSNQIITLMNHSIECVYDIFVNNMIGNHDELNILYNYYHFCFSDRSGIYHQHSLWSSRNECIKLAPLYCSAILKACIEKNIYISESDIETFIRNNMSFMQILSCGRHINLSRQGIIHAGQIVKDVYTIFPLELYNKFKNDYYMTNNKKYVLSHKMFWLLMFSIDVEEICDDLITYFTSVKDSIDFFVCNFYTDGVKTAEFYNFARCYTSYYDLKENIVHEYDICDFVPWNIAYVAYLCISKKFDNYRKVFRIYYFSNSFVKLYEDLTFNTVEMHIATQQTSYNIPVTDSNNLLDVCRKYLKNDDGTFVDRHFCYLFPCIRYCFLQVMYKMTIDDNNKMIFDDDDIEHACQVCDSIAMNIILRKKDMTDLAMIYLCRKNFIASGMIDDILNKKFIPKHDHIKDCFNNFTINVFLKHGLEVNDDLIARGIYYGYFEGLIEGNYDIKFPEKHINNMSNYNAYYAYAHMSDKTYKYCKNKSEESANSNLSTLLKNKFRDDYCIGNEMFAEILYGSMLAKYEVMRNHMLGFITVDKILYDCAVVHNDVELVHFYEKHFGFCPNEDTLSLIRNPFVLKDYLKRLINKNNA